MASFDDFDFFDYSFESAEFLLPNPSGGADIRFPPCNVAPEAQECMESDCPRKRERDGLCGKSGSKACREKLRRDRLNERFLELNSILEHGRPAKSDKSAILDDAIRLLNQLRAEAQDLGESNEKLREEIKSLKAEKNELRREKLVLKADKEKMEHWLKTMTIPPSGLMPSHPATYPAANKMAVFPGYGLVPMWQYLPPSIRDTSQDHAQRPPAA